MCFAKRFLYIILLSFILSLLFCKFNLFDATAKQKDYTISPNTKPLNKKIQGYSTYTKETKNYYTIRSYLEELEKKGGGKLVLKKGKYSITNTLFVPSNVTIQLNNGVILKKSMNTGSGNTLKPSYSMFQLVAPSMVKKIGMQYDYNGSTNINIISGGKATIDLNHQKNVNGIIAGHNENLLIKNIQFLNANEGYFIQLAATKHATIQNNTFLHQHSSSKPVISLDTAEEKNGNYQVSWSMYDGTPNVHTTIEQNYFYDIYQAISSKNATDGKPQNKIVIRKNKIAHASSNMIVMNNWRLSTVEDNTLEDAKGYGVYVLGSYKPVIRLNQLKKMKIPVKLAEYTSNGTVSENTVTLSNKKALASNKGEQLKEYAIPIEHDQFLEKIEITNLKDLNKAVYTVTPKSVTLNKEYLLRNSYTDQTKQYYALRSYMEQLEKQGGGKLVFKKGKYTITNVLYVPSNVTLEFEDGVEIIKGDHTGSTTINPSNSIFQLIRPSLSKKERVVGGHKGEKNIRFIGKGKVIFDLKFKLFSFAIIMGHNKNVEIQNIQFKNMNGGHFIEMDASENVIIRDNEFFNSIPSARHVKEAINLDTPDKTTLGWSSEWSNFDRTANKRILILNNQFKNLDRAIGTHKYSEGHPHKQIVIYGNTIDTTRNDAIRIMNWMNPTIAENVIKNVANGDREKRGILSSGAIHPKIQYNTFEKVGRPIQFIAWQNTGPGEQYKEIKDKLSNAEKELLKTNDLIDTEEVFARINNKYLEYNNPEKILLLNWR